MLILLRDTDIDGRPIIGSGLFIPGETAFEIAQKMQASSPFNEGDLTDYMRHVLDAAGDENALPGKPPEETAQTFLERLAQRGLVEFMKEESQPINRITDEPDNRSEATCADKQA